MLGYKALTFELETALPDIQIRYAFKAAGKIISYRIWNHVSLISFSLNLKTIQKRKFTAKEQKNIFVDCFALNFRLVVCKTF